MNQSNQSLQVSKNDSFSEQQQSTQPTSNNPDLDSLDSEYDRFNVDMFGIGTQHEVLSECYALREHADQWAKEFDPDRRQKLFVHSCTCFYSSEFSRDRQKLLCRIIGATRGTYFVVQGGDEITIKNHLISPLFQSREQAVAWRHLSLPYYPSCQIIQYESECDDNAPDARNEYDLVTGNHIMAFTVVYGDEPRQCLSIGDQYFTTEEQARRYQSEILPEYPTCQLSQHNFHFDHIYRRQELLERLFGHLKAENADNVMEV